MGVSAATISAKCREIWDGLELMQLDPDYIVESMAKDNPLAMLAELASGFPVELAKHQTTDEIKQPESAQGDLE